jgi:hypothetical protein
MSIDLFHVHLNPEKETSIPSNGLWNVRLPERFFEHGLVFFDFVAQIAVERLGEANWMRKNHRSCSAVRHNT